MIEEQMEATTNEQSNDVTMEDNDTPAVKQTVMAAGDFSQFNNNNKPTTTTNTSAKTDMNRQNEQR